MGDEVRVPINADADLVTARAEGRPVLALSVDYNNRFNRPTTDVAQGVEELKMETQ